MNTLFPTPYCVCVSLFLLESRYDYYHFVRVMFLKIHHSYNVQL